MIRPPLEVVSKWGTRPLDCCPAERAATGPLYPRRLHGAASSRASGAGQQEGLLRPVVPRHCRDLARGRGRPRTSRRTDRFLGCAAQLHSWGQNLLFHPHLHCLIPAGGLSPDHTRWIHPRYPFFLPVGVLRRVFRGKFVDALQRRFQQHQLIFPGSLRPLQNERAFRAFLRPLFRQNWIVYAKPPFGGPHHVLGYLAAILIVSPSPTIAWSTSPTTK